MIDVLGIMGFSGGPEVFVVLFVILLLFGAKKLPELSRSLGKSLGEFRKGQKEGEKPDALEDLMANKEIQDSPKKEEVRIPL